MRLSQTVPAIPVVDTAAAASFYSERLGFAIQHQHPGFARLLRDGAEVHLWQADDQSWRRRPDFTEKPVCIGAESFIAGTTSCRIEVDEVDDL